MSSQPVGYPVVPMSSQDLPQEMNPDESKPSPISPSTILSTNYPTQNQNYGGSAEDHLVAIPLSHFEILKLHISELQKQITEAKAQTTHYAKLANVNTATKSVISKKMANLGEMIRHAQKDSRKAASKRVSQMNDIMMKGIGDIGRLEKKVAALEAKLASGDAADLGMMENKKSPVGAANHDINDAIFGVEKLGLYGKGKKRTVEDEDEEMLDGMGSPKRLKKKGAGKAIVNGTTTEEVDPRQATKSEMDTEPKGDLEVVFAYGFAEEVEKDVEQAFELIKQGCLELQEEVEAYGT
ncbi:hypothetical protein EG329_001375 [Mollisiaceae sp. DMI_Dod_QoI]|nr:hypothetical protein EG329_001375 [Helotiales sp. DMI_Dod_QoI]